MQMLPRDELNPLNIISPKNLSNYFNISSDVLHFDFHCTRNIFDPPDLAKLVIIKHNMFSAANST